MDFITQGLLGAAAAQAIFVKQLPKHAWKVGAIAGMLPDLDVFIRSSTNPAIFMTYHRHFTHSLVFIPIGGLLAGLIAIGIFKELRNKKILTLLAAIIAIATHGIIDCFTSYGTLLLWPFTDYRIAWDFLPIVDIIFSSTLVLGLVFGQIKISRIPSICAFGLICLYVAYAGWQHHRALEMQEILAYSRGQQISKGRVIPQIGIVYRWRSVYLSNKKLYIDSIKTPLLKNPSVLAGFSIPLYRFIDLPSWARQNPKVKQQAKVFFWFTSGYVAKFSNKPLALADMRYLYSLKPLTSLWGVELRPNLDHIIWKRFIVDSINTN
ncbi:MAG: metal-dependent hydrolase [Pseudomonadota bacterium]